MKTPNNKIVCQICDKNQTYLYHQDNQFNLLECNNCGFIWLDPMPNDSEIKLLYNNAYNESSESYFIKVGEKLKRSRSRAKRFRKLFNKDYSVSFLDIGSNGGFMSEAARENGFISTGIEIDPISIKYAKKNYPKNEYFEGTVEKYTKIYPDKRFDFIYCSEVIEHIIDLNSFMNSIKNLLNKNGFLYITTPDIKHWRRNKSLKDWDAYCPPAHCLFFSKKSLDLLLKKNKFIIYKKYFAFKPGIKILAKFIN